MPIKKSLSVLPVAGRVNANDRQDLVQARSAPGGCTPCSIKNSLSLNLACAGPGAVERPPVSPRWFGRQDSRHECLLSLFFSGLLPTLLDAGVTWVEGLVKLSQIFRENHTILSLHGWVLVLGVGRGPLSLANINWKGVLRCVVSGSGCPPGRCWARCCRASPRTAR